MVLNHNLITNYFADIKKAIHWIAFLRYKWASVFSLICIFLPGVIWANDCGFNSQFERVAVDFIYDGDTVRLKDGRKIRFIGINTPELGHNKRADEPYAKTAQVVLRGLLATQKQLLLRYGTQRQDHYGRVLAHVFLPNGQNVAEILLEKGLGHVLLVPPNIWQLDCYLSAEQRARQRKRGIWPQHDLQPIEANDLSNQTRGFRLVRGQIKKITESKSSIWLSLSMDVTLRVAKADLNYFSPYYAKQLIGKQVLVKGWVYAAGCKGLCIQVRHPSAVNILD